MRNAAGFALAAALAAVILHASPWWPWRALCGPFAGGPLCDPAGMFGLPWLPSGGDWVARLLGGTWLQDASLLVWTCAAFALVTLAQSAWDRLSR